MRIFLFIIFGLILLCPTPGLSAVKLAPPNIVVILTDDQGYADISFNPNHPREVATPHMDALAREGVFFSQAYTSGHVCSPTRAGLMLGQYQQRVVFTPLAMAAVVLIQKQKYSLRFCRTTTPAWRWANGTWGWIRIIRNLRCMR